MDELAGWRAKFQSTISIQISTKENPRIRELLKISIHDIHTDIDGNGCYNVFMQINISIHDIHTDIDEKEQFKAGHPFISIHDIHTDIDAAMKCSFIRVG